MKILTADHLLHLLATLNASPSTTSPSTTSPSTTSPSTTSPSTTSPSSPSPSTKTIHEAYLDRSNPGHPQFWNLHHLTINKLAILRSHMSVECENTLTDSLLCDFRSSALMLCKARDSAIKVLVGDGTGPVPTPLRICSYLYRTHFGFNRLVNEIIAAQEG